MMETDEALLKLAAVFLSTGMTECEALTEAMEFMIAIREGPEQQAYMLGDRYMVEVTTQDSLP